MSSPEQVPNPPEPQQPEQPSKLRTGRYGDLEEHELIRLLDSINDERARARFRESIYISVFVWIAIAWFVFYGPQVLFHTPRLVDPATLLRLRHQEEIAQLNVPPELRRSAPRRAPAKPPTVDSKMLARLRASEPKPAPAPTPAPPPPPSNQPTVLPPVAPAPAPKPAPPRASAPTPIPEAPTPSPKVNFGNEASAADSVRSAANAAARGGYDIPSGPTHAPGRPGLTAGAQIVSDTEGVNFNDYMARLHDIIEHTWLPLLPESIRPPISEHGITGIDFKIMANGDIGGISFISQSGERALDRAAWGSITSVGKFPPLPKEFHGKLIELNCGFFVNEKMPGE